MATNHHILPIKGDIDWLTTYFPFIGKSFNLKRALGTWQEIDLTLFTISTNELDEPFLESDNQFFTFSSKFKKGHSLYSLSVNQQGLVVSTDSDCKLFSSEGATLISDPDSQNQLDYQVWSIAHGCDLAHGDSGSALISSKTGELVGINWTGKIPKDRKIRSRDYVDEIFKFEDLIIWKELSYTVSIESIHDYLTNVLKEDPEIENIDRSIIEALLNSNQGLE